MKVVLATSGTRGDYQPYVALGQRLQSEGHEALLLAPAEARGLAERLDVPFRAVEPSFRTMLAEGDVNPFDLTDSNEFAEVMVQRLVENMGLWCRSFTEQFPECDAVVSHPIVAPAINLAIARGIPLAVGYPYPKWPTERYPAVTKSALTAIPGGARFVAWRNDGQRRHFVEAVRPAVNDWRVNDLGLPPLARGQSWLANATSPTALMFAYSRHLRGQLINAPEGAITTGPWMVVEKQWAPSSETLDYIAHARGTLAVITAGSITGTPEGVARTMAYVSAARAEGLIPLILDGEAQDESFVDDVLVLNDAPHGQLLPDAAVLVHHGGAGTTHAACRSGIPSIVTPNNFDQQMWAETLRDLDICPDPIAFNEVSEELLRKAFREVRDPAMKHRAVVLGRLIYSEGGAATATRYLEALCRGGELPPAETAD